MGHSPASLIESGPCANESGFSPVRSRLHSTLVVEVVRSVIDPTGASRWPGVTIWSFEHSEPAPDRVIWDAQAALVARANDVGALHIQVAGPYHHFDHIDRILSQLQQSLDRARRDGDAAAVQQQSAHIIVLLDIDCVPLSPLALRWLVRTARAGGLAGNAQRTNSIDNGAHVYAAASCLAVSVGTLDRLGWPSARPTPRSDCCEEFTWAAEAAGVEVHVLRPVAIDEQPASGYWQLNDELGHYGWGTTFGTEGDGGLFWHAFEYFRPTESRWQFVMRNVQAAVRANRTELGYRRIGRDRRPTVRERFAGLLSSADAPVAGGQP